VLGVNAASHDERMRLSGRISAENRRCVSQWAVVVNLRGSAVLGGLSRVASGIFLRPGFVLRTFDILAQC
jgi:hypothetical protein